MIRVLLTILAAAAFVFSIGGLFFDVPHSRLQASLLGGFILLAAAIFWNVSPGIVAASLVIGLIIASGFFVRMRM
jgi:hypothetical protein